MKMNPHKFKAVLALPAPERYSHFIKVAANGSRVWGLYEDGWALMGTNSGQEVLPVWPAGEYAALYATDDWAGHKPRAIPIDEFLHDLLPSLREAGRVIAVFPVPGQGGVVPDLDVVEADLKHELSRIE